MSERSDSRIIPAEELAECLARELHDKSDNWSKLVDYDKNLVDIDGRVDCLEIANAIIARFGELYGKVQDE